MAPPPPCSELRQGLFQALSEAGDRGPVLSPAQQGVVGSSADHPAFEPSEHGGGVCTAPSGRVPKYKPDRTLSCEGRIINDARCYNLGCDKFRHPPALTPRHRELARTILWWQTRYPETRVFLSKRDVAAAFKLLLLDL